MLKNEEIYLKEIIEKYADMVYKLALTRTGTIENAEDVFQDVFIKFAEKMPEFENTEHEKAWFIRVTINFSKNLKNNNWNKKIVFLSENMIFSAQEETNVFSSVSELPKNYRTVIYLSYYEGYKVKEIAKILKKNENTVKTWLSRGRELLKEKLKGGFENE